MDYVTRNYRRNQGASFAAHAGGLDRVTLMCMPLKTIIAEASPVRALAIE